MKIYKLTFTSKSVFDKATKHLKDNDGNWLPVVNGLPVENIPVLLGYTEGEEPQPIYSDKYHVDMILSEPSGMEQYIDQAIAGGHYAHGYVGCELEVAVPL